MMSFFTREKETSNHSNKNGSLLLEELIASSDGKYNPIRMFSSSEILKATNNFDTDHIISKDRFTWYKGTIEKERKVLIKKWEADDPTSRDNIYRDIAVLSMMSSHKNVLKLLGCCVEFAKPVIVCEYAEKGSLQQLMDKDSTLLPWTIRLKICKEIANAVAYLHTAFPRIIINRDINPRNIFLDKNGTAKLSSFCLSLSIPEGESSVFDDKVVYGVYVDPEYNGTGLVSDKFDVYSFGVTLLFLLGGELGLVWLSAIIGEFGFPFPDYVGQLADQFIYVIDPAIYDGEIQGVAVQVEVFFELALKCVRFWPGQDMVTMIDVAKELKEIEGLVKVSSSDPNEVQD